MLEILSHQYLKRFIKSHPIDWEHIYSFGRIISKYIQNDKNCLINSEIFYTSNWYPAILISLFLYEEDSTFVLSEEEIQIIKNNYLQDLKNLGFDFFLEDDQIIFANHCVSLITLNNLLNNFSSSNFKNYRIIFSGIENIKENLKDHFRISLFKKDWLYKFDHSISINENRINTYNFLKKKFFLKKVLHNNNILLDQEEISFLTKFFSENSSFSYQFLKTSNALSDEWACWVKLDHINFEWNFYLEPIDELFEIKELFVNNQFIFLSALRRDNFFHKYLTSKSVDIDLAINFKSNFNEKKILLYAPPRQILPNNPFFNQIILDKCKKLIFFRNGLTLVLSDDINLKIKLATELAAIYGKRVLLETIPSLNNEILCASFNWWIKNAYLINCPEQIIIPLLPIPDIGEPINSITVSYNKKLSKDWFRDYLLPEAIEKLDKSVSPLRRNSGKLIILDGRVNKRKWGRSILQSIQPSKKISYMLPFD